jgi:hypothetical protein
MRNMIKYATAVTLTGALAVAMATPSQARHGRNAAVIGGFAAGAVAGAAIANSGYYYDNGYYYADPGYDYGYAYEPAPVYVEPYDAYAYEPAPVYRYRNWNRGRDDSIQSQR